MIQKDFWSKSTVAVIGAGSWGTVLAHLAAQNCQDVRLWARNEERAREINAKRTNAHYVPNLVLHPRVHAYTEMERCFEVSPQLVIWALPSQGTRDQARKFCKYFTGEEILLHATKGVEPGSLKRMTEILREEIPCPRIGVISGPNLAHEVARNEPAATVIASHFDEAVKAGQEVLTTPQFRVYGLRDVIGVEWAGTLKNILAIAAGSLDAMGLGWNARSMLISRGLAEMVRFGVALGGEESTFLGLAGVGDLLATCSSNLSRNYRVGHRLAQGDKLDVVLKDLGSTAEGVRTALSVGEFARERGIEMPITQGVVSILQGEVSAKKVLEALMVSPLMEDGPA